MNPQSLPTKKLFFIAGPIILFAIIFSIMRTPSDSSSLKNTLQVVDNASLPQFDDKDTDGDGLRDWEELLWGTDPKNPKSEGREVTDGEYVATLVKESPTVSYTNLNASTTLTEAFGVDFFNEYIALKQSGKLTNQTIQNLSERITEKVLNTESTANYTIEPQNLFNDSDTARVRIYGNSLAEIRARYQASYTSNPIQAGDFNNGGNNFLRASELYRDMANEMAELEVPRLLASYHEQLVQSYLKSGIGLRSVSTLDKDPMKAIVGIQMHTEAEQTEYAAVENIRRYFSQSGILFTSNEPGVIWNMQ